MPELEPNYRVIELEAENENLKDQLIDSLKFKVQSLELEIKYLRELINKPSETEVNPSSNMIAPNNFRQRPVIRTLSEVGAILERRSLNGVLLPKSAEDIKNES